MGSSMTIDAGNVARRHCGEFGSVASCGNRLEGRCHRKADRRSQRDCRPPSRGDRNLPATRRDDAIPQQADVVGDGQPSPIADWSRTAAALANKLRPHRLERIAATPDTYQRLPKPSLRHATGPYFMYIYAELPIEPGEWS